MLPPVGERPTASTRPRVCSLDDLVGAADRLDGLRKEEVAPGDRVLVATRNSVYALVANDDGSFEVSGGYYLRHFGHAVRMRVVGCSAGGRAIFTRMIAAPGLFLEFEDGTRTTRIQRVRRQRASASA
jgi:hypothetical protein